MTNIKMDLIELRKQINEAAEKVTQLVAKFSDPFDLKSLNEIGQAYAELKRLSELYNKENGGSK